MSREVIGEDGLGRGRLQLLMEVARLYYVEGMDQSAVARAVGYSRPAVSRFLTEARKRRIVRFTVGHPLEQVLELETKMKRAFGLAHVFVAGLTPDPAGAVGALAAQAIEEAGNAHTMLALSNGRSVAAVVDAMPRANWHSSCVIQMIGALAHTDQLLVDSPELCRRMADRLGGTHRPLPVPIVVARAAVAQSMLREEVVLTTLELAARSDIALLGVGAVGPGLAGAIIRPFVTPQVEQELRRAKAVAHICGHHFDATGKHVRTSLCERMIAMEPERLAGIAMSMVVAWGVDKVPAIHAVLRSGLASALATDEETAQLLLSYDP